MLGEGLRVVLSRVLTGKMQPKRRVYIGGVELEAVLKISSGALEMGLMELGDAAVAKGDRETGFQANCPAEILNGAVVLALLGVSDAPIAESLREIGFQANHVVEIPK